MLMKFVLHVQHLISSRRYETTCICDFSFNYIQKRRYWWPRHKPQWRRLSKTRLKDILNIKKLQIKRFPSINAIKIKIASMFQIVFEFNQQKNQMIIKMMLTILLQCFYIRNDKYEFDIGCSLYIFTSSLTLY